MNHISATRKEAARRNIEIKLNILRSWLRDGVPRRDRAGQKYEYYPSTLRQFKLWDGSQNSKELQLTLPTVTKTGNDTLELYPDLKSNAAVVIAALVEKYPARQISKRADEDIIKRDLAAVRSLLSLRNREVMQQQRELLSLRRQVSTLQRAMGRK